MKCDKCRSKKITHYRQTIKGGRVVVTARCENGHHPVTGKPFYPQYLFKLDKLPPLEQADIMPMFESLPVITQTKQPYRNFPFPLETK
jgi:hypothetical protein